MSLGSMRRSVVCVYFVLASSALGGCASSPEDPPSPAPPELTVPPAAPTTPAPAGATITPATPREPFDPLKQITSGEDITVESVKIVTPRTFDIIVTTPNISPNAKMTTGNGIRVTLPENYDSAKKYPVIYFLHGATCNYTTNHEHTDLEKKVSGVNGDVIVVMPEGGRAGFYTDWVDQSPVQKWTTYHLTQLVPFIDRNLRTIPAKEGRAVMGISMGGLGAMRYATERPELFAAAATLSGAVDLQHVALQIGIAGILNDHKLNPSGPFGDAFSSVWGQKNPVRHADKLATVKTFIYVGSGSNDLTEQVTTSAGHVLSKALSEAKVEHVFKDYGAPGETPEGFCNGGHTVPCFRYAFADVLPRIVESLARPR